MSLKIKEAAMLRWNDQRAREETPVADHPSLISAQDQNKLLKAALDASPLALAIYDKNDILVFHNKTYETIYKEVLPHLPTPVHYADLVRGNLRNMGYEGDLEAEVIKRVKLQREPNSDIAVYDRQYADGVWRRVYKRRIEGDAIAGYAQDITELRQREQQLEVSVSEMKRIATELVPSAIQEFTSVADSLFASSQQVQTLVERSSEQALETGSAAEELAVTVKDVAHNTRDTANFAEESLAMAQEMTNQMQQLSDELSKVMTFADMIRSIAGQTNLLALNATIEAARAGEAGRGFSVVAAEVKALALQTSQATAQIALQVSNIEHLMHTTRSTTEGIIDAMNGISMRSSGIASAVEQQLSAADSVSENMSDVIKRNAETKSAAANTANTGVQMRGTCRNLEETVLSALAKVS
jgi:methyl-accepting chemotaxis protein